MSQGSHSLAFRVMRLCRPSVHVDPPLLLDPADLLIGEDLLDDPIAAENVPHLIGGGAHVADPSNSDPNYRGRFLLHQFSDAMGLSGLLVLPQSFGYRISLSYSRQFSIFFFIHLVRETVNPGDAERFIWERLSVAT